MSRKVWTSEAIDTLWDFDDAAGSETRFREAVEAGAGDEARTQIARALGLQRKFDEAQAVLDSIGLDGAPPIIQVRKALEQGRTLRSSGNASASLPFFRKSLEIAQESGFEFYAVDAAHMIAIASPADESLDWNLKAIAMAEAATDPRARNWLGSLLNNTGWSLHDLKRYDEALTVFQKALAFREEQGNERPIRIAKWCIARCLRSMGRTQEALDRQMELLEESSEAGFVNEELGECLLTLGRIEEARAQFAKAHMALSKDPWLVANEPERLARMLRIAQGEE